MEDLEDAVRGDRQAQPLVIPHRRAAKAAGAATAPPARPVEKASAAERPAAEPSAAKPSAPAPASGAATATWDADVEGWKTRDLLVVGALTFVMVVAVVLALLV